MRRIFHDDWRNGRTATVPPSALEVSSEDDVFLMVVTDEGFPVPKRLFKWHWKKCEQQFFVPLLCSQEKSENGMAGTLVASSSEVLGTERMWTCWREFRGSHRDDHRDWDSLLWGKAETLGAAHPGEEKDQRRLNGSIPASGMGLKGSRTGIFYRVLQQ